MNILTLSTIDTRGGGSKIPWNLMQEARKRGHNASMFVGFKYSDDKDVHRIPLQPLYHRLSKLFADDLRFSRSGMLFETEQYKAADIVHCHNIHSGFFNWSDFERIAQEKKVIWTIHDLWPLTSGCTDLYRCAHDEPRRMLGFLWDNRPHLLEQKKRVYENVRFEAVAPCTWMQREIQASIMGHMPATRIYNGIDTDIFRPHAKQEVRQELGLPQDRTIILFVATNGLNDERKGAAHIQRALAQYADRQDILFVVLGGKGQEPSAKLISPGHLDDERLLSKYYAASDLLLYPSLGDNCPLVVMEAMACGIPVVSFRTGGIPEIVNACGFIAPYNDGDTLLQGLESLLSLPKDEYRILSERCVERIRKHFSLTRMADEYLELYSKIAASPI